MKRLGTYIAIAVFTIIAISVLALLYISIVSKHITHITYTFSINKPTYESLLIYSALYGNKSEILEIARSIEASPILVNYILKMFVLRTWTEGNITQAEQLISQILNRTNIRKVILSSKIVNTITQLLEKANFSLNTLNLTYIYYVRTLISGYAKHVGDILVKNYVNSRRGIVQELWKILKEIENKTSRTFTKLKLIPTGVTIRAPQKVLIGTVLNISGRAYEKLHGREVPLPHTTIRIIFGKTIISVKTGSNGTYMASIKIPISDSYIGKIPLIAMLLPNTTIGTAGSMNFTTVNVLPLPVNLTVSVRGVLCSHGQLSIDIATVSEENSSIDYAGVVLLKLGTLRKLVNIGQEGRAHVIFTLPYGNISTTILCVYYTPTHRYLDKARTCIDVAPLLRPSSKYLIEVNVPRIVLYPLQNSVSVRIRIVPISERCSLSATSSARLVLSYGRHSVAEIVEIGTVSVVKIPISMNLLRFAREVTIGVNMYPLQVCALPSSETVTILVLNLYTLAVGAAVAVIFILATGAVYVRLRRRETSVANVGGGERAFREVVDIERERDLVSIFTKLCSIFRLRVEKSDTVRQIAMKLARVLGVARDFLIWLVRTYEAVRFGEKLHLIDTLRQGIEMFKEFIRRVLRRQ